MFPKDCSKNLYTHIRHTRYFKNPHKNLYRKNLIKKRKKNNRNFFFLMIYLFGFICNFFLILFLLIKCEIECNCARLLHVSGDGTTYIDWNLARFGVLINIIEFLCVKSISSLYFVRASIIDWCLLCPEYYWYCIDFTGMVSFLLEYVLVILPTYHDF